MASFRHTAFAAMMWTSGPPCMPGNVSLSISFAYAAWQSTMPARGPRSVLCVVVETMSACGTGLGCTPAATRPAMCAMSTKKIASTALATLPMRQLFDFVVIDALVFLAHAVSDKFVHTPGKIQRMPVRQMTAMRQIHAQHRVAGLQRGHVHRDVRRGSRMCLHVGVLRAKQFLGAIDGQLLDLVGVFAAAVIPLARITLRVFVGEDRAHSIQHRLRDQILRRN